jgi:hypothetical protein
MRTAREERTSWKERVGGARYEDSNRQREKEREKDDSTPATAEAEKKVGESQKGKEKEVIQVPGTQQGSEESVPATQW